MTKNQKIFFWVLIIAIAILILYIIATAKKEKPQPKPQPTDVNNPGPVVDNSDAGQAGINTSAPPAKVDTTQFVLNDKIYAGENTLNVYKACAPSTTNIAFTFNKGDYIGDFVKREGNCIVVRGPYGLTVFGKFFQTGTKDYYILFNANIYK